MIKNLLKEGGLTIACAAAVLCGYRWLTQPSQMVADSSTGSPAKPQASIDMIASIDGKPLTSKQLSVVLILSPKCRYCLDSTAFYSTLASKVRRLDASLIALVPEVAASKQFLSNIGIASTSVHLWRDFNSSISGTPTILLLDSQGKIKRIFRGALTPQREADLLGLLNNPADLEVGRLHMDTGEKAVNDAQLAELRATARPKQFVRLVDLREREEFASVHGSDALNIPFDELGTRAPFELKRSDIIVLDCSGVTSRVCQSAVDAMSFDGFRNLSVRNPDRLEDNICKTTSVEASAGSTARSGGQ